MKAIIVVDIPYIQEHCEIDELGLVADMHIRPTTLSLYKSFDLKDVDVRPMPKKYIEREIKIETERDVEVCTHGITLGRNLLIEEIEE